MTRQSQGKSVQRKSGGSSRGGKRSPARGATRTPPPAPPRRGRGRLVLVGGAALGVVALLVFALIRLAAVPPDPQANQQAVQSETRKEPARPAAKPAPEPKPAAQEDRYRFYTLLPESEVVPPKVEAYESRPREAVDYSRYLLQVGSFRRQEDAERLRARLLLEGFPNVTSEPATSANGTVWYRVRVGPFPSRSKLNKAQDRLVRMDLRPLLVTRSGAG